MQLKNNLSNNTVNPYETQHSEQAKTDWQEMQPKYHVNDDIPPPNYQQYNTSPVAYELQQSNPQNQNIKQEIFEQGQRRGCLSHLCDGSLEANARSNFIKKVYMILTLQLLITVGMCFASYYSPHFLNFQIDNYWLMWVCLGLMLVSEIFIFCCQAGRVFPLNLILLTIFTLSEAYMVSFITSMVADLNGGAIVVIAACMTLSIVVALTLYAMITRSDFTTGWGILVGVVAPFILFGIFAWIAWVPILHNLYCALGAALFAIYLVIDTQLIVGGGRYELSMDDYIAGALLLYIDIIQIFLYILSALGSNN